MCDFCEKFDFGNASYEVDKYGARILLAGGAFRFPEAQKFSYCPVCGKSRVEIESERYKRFEEKHCAGCGIQLCGGVYDKNFRESCRHYRDNFC